MRRVRPSLAGLSVALLATAHAQVPSVELEHFLPVHSARLQVGVVEPQYRPTGVSRPFFLIGTDETSRRWLETHAERLRGLQAFGLVVEAPDTRAYERITALGAGLVIRPVNADLIAEHLGLEHYPVLITADGVFP